MRELCALIDASRVNAVDATGASALHYAAMRGNDLVMTELLRAGASVDVHNAQDMTPLHIACVHGQVAPVICLLAHGADPNAAQCGIAPLYCAVINKHKSQIVRLLLKHGAMVEGMKAIGKKNNQKATGDICTITEMLRIISTFNEMASTKMGDIQRNRYGGFGSCRRRR